MIGVGSTPLTPVPQYPSKNIPKKKKKIQCYKVNIVSSKSMF